MVPWNKLSKETQRAILALVVMSGSAASTRCCPPVICDPPPPPRTSSPIPRTSPIICDPAPPPSMTPTRFQTPVICDPPPPPARTPTSFKTPIICDPPPPPAQTRASQATATPIVRRFQLRRLQMSTDASLKGAAVYGKIFDAKGQPLAGIALVLQSDKMTIEAATSNDGSFYILVPNPGASTLILVSDRNNPLSLQLKQFDVAYVEFMDLGAQTPLPLAEIRSVDIVWGDDLTFQVDTPWQGARYRWTVSGGALIEEGDSVTWEPPAKPGNYLLQLVADWGRDGLAVDVLTLFVTEDGNIVIG
jgi:hypothetical protein